jgi:hypothetical protein
MAPASAPTSPRSTGGAARAHRFLAIAILFGALVQFFLAGLAAFGADPDVWDGHAGFGSVLTLLGLVLLILAAVRRKEALQASAVLFGLFIVQHVLGAAGREVEIIGAFHPLNGLLILGVAVLAAAGRRVKPASHASAPA